jgi:hypothetical protein
MIRRLFSSLSSARAGKYFFRAPTDRSGSGAPTNTSDSGSCMPCPKGMYRSNVTEPMCSRWVCVDRVVILTATGLRALRVPRTLMHQP